MYNSPVRKWWVWAVVVHLPAILLAEPFSKTIAAASVTPELRASLSSDYLIDVVVTPHEGDAWTRLAKRVTGDAERWHDIAAFNKAGDNLTSEQRVHVPLSMLRGELQKQIVASLFPRDGLTDRGWRHVVAGGTGIEGESLWNIAEWFTGRGERYAAIRSANPGQGLSTRTGDVILIPRELLTAAFGGEVEGRNAPKTAQARKSEDDPVERSSADGHDADAPVEVRSTARPVARIPVGYPVRIPMELLLPEYRPADDPARVADEATKRASAKLAKRARARGLAGVRVILDAGHGGRDVGAIHDGVSESSYVYDVMCRLKRIIEKRSAAAVSTTTKSASDGYDVVDSDALDPQDDHVVLTTPRYALDDDTTVGVNLRWYLANSIFRRAVKRGVPREKVVFLSLHADSLHPALRGTMAYIPGSDYVTGSYEKSGGVYLARAEVREAPTVRHTEKESLTAEGLSRDLAESIVDAIESKGLQVHAFNPVRDNVVRNGREWVPAVIRYNLVPTRILLEICNLGNARDRALMKTKAYRQKLASRFTRASWRSTPIARSAARSWQHRDNVGRASARHWRAEARPPWKHIIRRACHVLSKAI